MTPLDVSVHLYAKFDYSAAHIELPIRVLSMEGGSTRIEAVCAYDKTCDLFMRTADRSAEQVQFGLQMANGNRIMFRGYVKAPPLEFPIPPKERRYEIGLVERPVELGKA